MSERSERRERFVAFGGTAAFTALAILTALIVGALVIAFSDADVLNEWGEVTSDPMGALRATGSVVYDAYFALFDTSVNGSGPISRTLVEAAPLLLAGLSVTLAFRSGLFNIGGAGQLMMGAIAAAYVGFHFDLPTALHLPLALLAGIAGGAFWASIAGFLKARTGAHEVISTIMLNFIALRFLDWLLSLEAFQREGRDDPLTPPVLGSAKLPALPGPLDLHSGVLLAALATVGVWWLLERSTVGFRMRAVGTNPDAARAAGMRVGNTYILAMALAGGLMGLAGTVNLLGRPSYSVSGGFYAQVGFDALALALVGRSKPFGVAAAALLFGAFKAGSTGMQAATDTPVDIIIVIQALIIGFVAAPAIVVAIWRFNVGKGGTGQQFSAGWGGIVTDVLLEVPEGMPEEPHSESALIVLDRAAHHRARTLSLVAIGVGIAAIALFSRAVGDSTFILNERGDDTLPDLVVPAGPTAAVLGAIAIALGVWSWVRARPRTATTVLAVAFALFVAAMLVWATAGGSTQLVGLFSGTLRRASPIALGALAGVLCERAGVVNIAIEGMMLSGAFAGAVIGSASDSIPIGILGGIAFGLAFGAVLAVLSIRYRVDQIVGGTFINLFALGMTSFLTAGVLNDYPDLNDPPTVTRLAIPGLSEIPFIGPVLFDNTMYVYAMFVLVGVVTVALFRTRWGLRMRSVGEHPSAADTVGIDVRRVRFRAVLLGGAVAGFAGTFLTLDSAGEFQENMTAGQGFIALAAVIFGRWHPVGALWGALLFGFSLEFQGRLAALESPIPSQFLLMAPYLVTLVVVAGLIGKARPPAADGVPFER